MSVRQIVSLACIYKRKMYDGDEALCFKALAEAANSSLPPKDQICELLKAKPSDRPVPLRFCIELLESGETPHTSLHEFHPPYNPIAFQFSCFKQMKLSIIQVGKALLATQGQVNQAVKTAVHAYTVLYNRKILVEMLRHIEGDGRWEEGYEPDLSEFALEDMKELEVLDIMKSLFYTSQRKRTLAVDTIVHYIISQCSSNILGHFKGVADRVRAGDEETVRQRNVLNMRYDISAMYEFVQWCIMRPDLYSILEGMVSHLEDAAKACEADQGRFSNALSYYASIIRDPLCHFMNGVLASEERSQKQKKQQELKASTQSLVQHAARATAVHVIQSDPMVAKLTELNSSLVPEVFDQVAAHLSHFYACQLILRLILSVPESDSFSRIQHNLIIFIRKTGAFHDLRSRARSSLKKLLKSSGGWTEIEILHQRFCQRISSLLALLFILPHPNDSTLLDGHREEAALKAWIERDAAPTWKKIKKNGVPSLGIFIEKVCRLIGPAFAHGAWGQRELGDLVAAGNSLS